MRTPVRLELPPEAVVVVVVVVVGFLPWELARVDGRMLAEHRVSVIVDQLPRREVAKAAVGERLRMLAVFSLPDGDTPTWAYWVDQARITELTGQSLFDLGDYPGATRELAAALEAHGDSYPRDRATLLGQIATAQLRTGNIEDRSGRDLRRWSEHPGRGLDEPASATPTLI
jgi:hypothetical protein